MLAAPAAGKRKKSGGQKNSNVTPRAASLRGKAGGWERKAAGAVISQGKKNRAGFPRLENRPASLPVKFVYLVENR